jgi:hypothetical protein
MCHLLALLGAHHILHVSRIRVNLLQAYINNNTITYTPRPCNSNTTNTKHATEWTDKKGRLFGAKFQYITNIKFHQVT